MLKLTCTANDMRPLAEAADFHPPVHKWKPAERGEILADLDAAFFLLYGINREDMEYILRTFQGLRKEDGGMFPVGTAIVEAYERMAGERRE